MRSARVRVARGVASAVVLSCALAGRGRAENFCSRTAGALYDACKAGAIEEGLIQKAICLNVSDASDRNQCTRDATDARDEANQLCVEQRDWRLAACKTVGESRYDPDFAPALFDDPRNPTNPNRYFPLQIGNRWELRGGNEVNIVEVVDESKLIAGVGCIVVRDLVYRDGDLAEATDDWYAHAKNGATWYFGEEVKDFESFEGDDPRRPELVSIDGSFKAGRDRDKPGIIFLANPTKGAVYFEEFSLANAEDVTEILAVNYGYGNDADLDRSVPQQLAERLCNHDCVVTRNFSLLEPDVDARKYYGPGIGVFLEVESTGETSQLVNCNFDARCQNLPQP